MLMPGLTALIVGLILAALFSFSLNQRGPWNSFLWFFLVIFLGTWAIGSWITPVGPTWMGVSWFPFLIAALAISLLLLAASEPRRPASAVVAPESEAEAEVATAVGFFFWLLVLLLAILIGVGAVS